MKRSPSYFVNVTDVVRECAKSSWFMNYAGRHVDKDCLCPNRYYVVILHLTSFAKNRRFSFVLYQAQGHCINMR